MECRNAFRFPCSGGCGAACGRLLKRRQRQRQRQRQVMAMGCHGLAGSGWAGRTRREPIHGGSMAPSMAPTVLPAHPDPARQGFTSTDGEGVGFPSGKRGQICFPAEHGSDPGSDPWRQRSCLPTPTRPARASLRRPAKALGFQVERGVRSVFLRKTDLTPEVAWLLLFAFFLQSGVDAHGNCPWPGGWVAQGRKRHGWRARAYRDVFTASPARPTLLAQTKEIRSSPRPLRGASPLAGQSDTP